MTKDIIVKIMIGALIGSFVLVAGISYKKGYDSATEKAQEAHQKLLVERLNESNTIWQVREQRLLEELLEAQKSIREVEVVRDNTIEVIKYVDRTIRVKDECRDLSNDVVRVLEQVTSITGDTRATK